MKKLALLLIFAFMTSSFADDNNGAFREWSKPEEMKRSDQMHFPKQQRNAFLENLKMFGDSSQQEGNIERKMVEKNMDEPTGLVIDYGKEEMLEELKERVAGAFQRSALETSPNIFSFHRMADVLSKGTPSIHVPTTGISLDMNLHELKDLLEGGMGFPCDDEKADVGPTDELEGELIEQFAFGEIRCMPEKAIYHGSVNGVSNKLISQPQRNRMEPKDVNLQILHDTLDEMLGWPCHGGKEGSKNVLAKGPVLYSGVGKLRRVRQKYQKNSKECDVPKKASCTPLQRLHKTSDVDLKQLNQFLEGMMGFPCNDEERGGRKPNKLEMKLFKYCGVGKIYRIPDSLSNNPTANVPFNKTTCGAEQNVGNRMDLDFEKVNDLLEEAMGYFGKKGRKKGSEVQDLQDWMYGYCGFGKVRRLSLNSFPHRKENDASHKTSCNPLESSRKPTREVLHQLGLFLDEMMGLKCDENCEEEMVENTKISRLYEYCGISKLRLLPEGYFVNRNESYFSKTDSCSELQSHKDPLNLSLKQVGEILEKSVGIPKEGVIAEVGEGLYLICCLTKFQILSEPLDSPQSRSDFSKRIF